MFNKVLNQFDFGDDADVPSSSLEANGKTRSVKFVLPHNGYGLLIQQTPCLYDGSVTVTLGYVSLLPHTTSTVLPLFKEDLTLGRDLLGVPSGTLGFASPRDVKRIIACLAKKPAHPHWSKPAFLKSSAVENLSVIEMPMRTHKATKNAAMTAKMDLA